MFIFFKIIILCILFFNFPSAQAREKLGVLSVEDIFLRPYFLVREGQEAEFGLGETSLALSWFKSQDLGGIVRLGPRELINPMIHFSDEVKNELTIIEAFAQLSGLYGRLRMGLIPIEFGIEGVWQESEMSFPRSFIFEKRLVPLRDFGLSYQVGVHGYYTRIAIHNGESESENKDGRMFYTASWGWSDYKNLDIGISSLTGTTKPLSTQTVTQDSIAGVNVNKMALWRMGQLYIYWHPNEWFFLSEFLFGELEQSEKVTKFSASHLDLGYRWNPNLKIFVRYDQFDPNESMDKDLLQKSSLALVFSDKYNTNSLYLIATKIYEQGNSINNDEFRLIWSLTPRYQD